ncbi:hypothetical protein O181_089533 [Austropuccinia psidii MF-1]|uniref:Uncharacterized protein n=1 Tax=Austropuccinia psidii MF-1 TaxID=1389203 RepID=A0A9Q3ITF8_9BASI|nr:hypothetical protein [Austropuccinia psidii MF-1]
MNEIVETEDHNGKEEETDPEKHTEESEASESDEINITNPRINNIDLIYEVLNVNPTYHKNAFENDKKALGAIIGHKIDIILNLEKPYPPLLRRPAYPAIPRARNSLEVYIKELIDLAVLRKVGHNEQVEVTTPVIIAWLNGKSRMVGDVRALKTYTIPDRYPITRILETLTQLSQAKFITAMDSLKGLYQNFLTDNLKNYSG